jgi:hypothetical protein
MYEQFTPRTHRNGSTTTGVAAGACAAQVAAAAAAAVVFALGGCAPLEDTVYFADQDFTPPSMVSIEATGPTTIVARFTEDTTAETAHVSAELGEVKANADGPEVTFETERAGEIGRPYQLEAVVADGAGNTMSFVETVYGFNPDVPTVIINELTTQGSGNHPDVVELRLRSAGNLGGLTLYAGAPGEHDGRLVFPAVELPAEAYIVVHFKPEGLPEEMDELDDRTASGGLDASDTGWDFWVPGGTGISGNNGAVSLYAQPGGRLIDAIVYSNRTSDSDERYRGFGSKKALAMVDRVAADGGWVPPPGAGTGAPPASTAPRLAPEDAVDPEDSTATRSISRGSDGADTDTKADWHITPTSGYTFGGPNTDEVYEP